MIVKPNCDDLASNYDYLKTIPKEMGRVLIVISGGVDSTLLLKVAKDVLGDEVLAVTGAAILTTLASDFGPMPAMSVEQIGYGSGTSDPSIPNLLRVIIGETADEVKDCDMEKIAVLETNIDDMNPQIL
jgi:uncharacterized protein (DUF111 family)